MEDQGAGLNKLQSQRPSNLTKLIYTQAARSIIRKSDNKVLYQDLHPFTQSIFKISPLSSFALLRNGITTPPPNNGTIYIKNVWHRNQKSTDASENSECPMNTHVLVERDPNNRHTASSAIARDRHESQSRCSVNAVRVDDIHVRADEHADGTEPEQSRGENRRPN